MRKFNEFGIKTESKSFTGEKIGMNKILNKPIVVNDFRIVESRFQDKGNGKCLHMQITINDTKRVVFSGSTYLMQQIEKVPRDEFPFETTIVNESDRLEFT